MEKLKEIKEIENKNKYKKKETDIKYENLVFPDFACSKYSMTVKVDASKLYEHSKKNNIRFFNLTLACLITALNEVPELRRRIINKQVVEYENISGLTPILQEDKTIKEIEMPPPYYYNSFKDWNDYLEYKKQNIEKEEVHITHQGRAYANFSCIPWIHFESMTNIVFRPYSTYQNISLGKMFDGKIPISLTASHNILSGYHFKLFYDSIEKYFKNSELITKL